MKHTKESALIMRDSIMKLLNDDEVGRVSMAEAANHLSADDEYLDLGHLDKGVQKAHGSTPVMGRVLPRKAVREGTWSEILTQLT